MLAIIYITLFLFLVGYIQYFLYRRYFEQKKATAYRILIPWVIILLHIFIFPFFNATIADHLTQGDKGNIGLGAMLIGVIFGPIQVFLTYLVCKMKINP